MTQSEILDETEEFAWSPALASMALLLIAVAGLLHWLIPLEMIADIERIEDLDPLFPALVGGVLAACGIALSVAGHSEMKRRSGDVAPWKPTSVLVTGGVYGWTRNPGYLGLWISLAGVGLVFALDWLLILVVASSIIVHLCVVRREEASLAQKFGRQYQDYKRRVPRYVFIH